MADTPAARPYPKAAPRKLSRALRKAEDQKKKPAPAGEAAPAAKRVEIDPKDLDREKAVGRLDTIYHLQKALDLKQAKFDLATSQRKVAEAELEEARDQLRQEIDEQRYGPGPLFNAAGDGPAKVAAAPKF